MSGFLGMRGTGDWVANQRPENWRQMILRLYPNGTTPLTAILSMLGSESTDDPVFHWWTKGLPRQGGAVTGVFLNADLTLSAGTAPYAAGTTVYFKTSEEVASEFKSGHQAATSKEGVAKHIYIGKVTNVFKNGANSAISVRLLETVSTTYPIVSTTSIDVSGSMHPEGATIPDAISYNPKEHFNYTQIFRTALSITRTARRTRLRTGDAYQEAKREALELHAIEMEKAFIDSVRSFGIGSNGKPERSTYGIRKFLLDNVPQNVFHYPDTTYGPWLTPNSGGEQWLDEALEFAFRYGGSERLALAGNGAVLQLQRLVKFAGQMTITPRTVSYGLNVGEWVTPFGTIYIKTHPLFNDRADRRNDILLLEPKNLKFRYIDDTFFVEDPMDRKNRNNSRDGTEEEFITEAGLEIHHPETMAYLSGFGMSAPTS